MTSWVIEKDMLSLLGTKLDFSVFLGYAPEKQKEPFGVLNLITTGSVRALDYYHPGFQLDVFEVNPEKVTILAEKTVRKLNFIDSEVGETLFDSIRAERVTLIRVEDGTYKIPIEITCNAIRRK